MVRLNLTALLYSNKNIDLAYKSKKICRDYEINLINALDFVDLTIKILQIKPQIVFFDLSTVSLKKDIMELFVSRGLYFIPNIILLYNNEEQLKEYNDFEFVPVKVKDLEKFLLNNEKSLKFKAIVAKNEKASSYECVKSLNKILLDMDFTAKHTGYAYLIEAIKILLKKEGVARSLNNEVYPLIAAKYGTRIINVERNIRNAIMCAWENNITNPDKHSIHSFPNMFKRRPTNREFICLFVGHMLNLEGKMAI